MSTRIDLNAKVRTRDGEDAGSIERAILDPSGTWVREFVVDTGGLLGRPVLVPSAEVEASARDGDVLRLRLSKTELDRLPTYVPERYVAPPMTWVPPVGLGFPEGSYLWPAALVDTSPAGRVAPIATAEAASTATPGASDRNRVVRPDDGDVGISRDAVVLDRDGNDVGVVDEVRIDPATDAVQGFMLRVGGLLGTLFGRGEKVEVTRSQIDHVNEGVVQLRLTKDELERLAKQAAT